MTDKQQGGYQMKIKQEESRRKAIEGQIDENLKRVYTEITEEEVPDRFLKLLEQLKQQEQKP